MGLKMLCVVVLVCVVHNVLGGHHATWNYAAKGPKTWTGACLGKQQSPINIDLRGVRKPSQRSSKVFSHNYWETPTGTYKLHNNGHALQIDLPGNTTYRLKKGGQTYTPLQIHIHFDPVTGRGSEHTLNKKKFFAEIHIVHKNSKYRTKKQIMGNKDGLLVIGMFVNRVKVSDFLSSDLDFSSLKSQDKTPNYGTSFVMKIFGLGAKKCQRAGKSIRIRSFPLAWVLPSVGRKGAKYDYVNYRGSLTTPPCSQIVDWVVITGKTLQVNEKLAKLFKKVKNGGRTRMAGNNRPVQKLYGRKLYGVKGTL